jgi:release factor glutamine methyltransferase
MSISIAEAIRGGAEQLRKAGVPEPRREAGSLIAHVIGQDRSFILTHAEESINDEHEGLFREWLGRRANGEPLQYLTGRQEFYGLDFEVTRDVLIPRPETELLIEAVLKLWGESSVAPSFCDVGTGSGCIAITLLNEQSEARGVAVDLSPRALEVAKRNASRHSVADRLELIESDCFSAFYENDSSRFLFDAIVSNPPYVKEHAFSGLQREVRDFEPRMALAAGDDGLIIIRRLVSEAPKFLKTGGHFLFEIGFDQGEVVQALIDRKIWNLLDIHEDLQSIPRIVALQKLS